MQFVKPHSFPLSLLFIPSFTGLLLYFLNRKTLPTEIQKLLNVSLLLLISVEVSLLIGGKSNFHYIIQLMPMMAIYFAFTYYTLTTKSKDESQTPIVKYVPMSLVLLLVYCSTLNYSFHPTREKSKQPIREGCVVEHLKSNLLHEDSLYILEGHIIYWLVGKEPLKPIITHPSNLLRDYLLKYIPGSEKTSEAEFYSILNHKPRYIVTPDKVWYFSDEKFSVPLKNHIADNYHLAKKCDILSIYELN